MKEQGRAGKVLTLTKTKGGEMLAVMDHLFLSFLGFKLVFKCELDRKQ